MERQSLRKRFNKMTPQIVSKETKIEYDGKSLGELESMGFTAMSGTSMTQSIQLNNKQMYVQMAGLIPIITPVEPPKKKTTRYITQRVTPEFMKKRDKLLKELMTSKRRK